MLTELVELGAELQAFFESRDWRFSFIGGLAVIRWGEPRFTRDVDVTLLTGFGTEEAYVDVLLDRFEARAPEMRQFALEKRVVLLQSAREIPIDIALGALPFEERLIKRSRLADYGDGMRLRTCSAEDLIVTKAFAERGRDWEDVRGILIRQGAKLNWSLIERELKPLCELKEAPHILTRLEELRKSSQE